MAKNTNFLDFSEYMNIEEFIVNGIMDDSTTNGRTPRSNGILRLNRFVCMIDVLNLQKLFPSLGHNNEISGDSSSGGGWGSNFLAWNVFKVDCPSLRLGVISKEVDMRPRYYFENWMYDDLSISFLESSDLKMRHFFFEWMVSALSSVTYARSYYDDVMCPSIHVYPLNFQGQAERYEVFRELVPFDVSAIPFDVSDNGETLALTTVKFKYTSHEVLSLPQSKSS
jgi:hypothetical protein